MERKKVSGIILMLLIMAVSTSMINFHLVKATPTVPTITINADGTVDPPTAPIDRDEDVYTFNGSITYPTYYGILVKRSNIIIDGAGYVVGGNETGNGFELNSINNVTIKNTNILSFEYGIYLSSASNNKISGNNMTDNNYGIGLYSSSNYNSILGNNITNNNNGIALFRSSEYNSIFGNNITNNNNVGIGLYSSSNYISISRNNITNNNDFGLELFSSSNNVLSGNVLNGNRYNLHVGGNKLSHFMQSIDNLNLVEGKPVYYLVDQKDLVINATTYPEIGYLALVNSRNIRVEGLTLTNRRQGLLLAFTNNSRITDNTITNNYYGAWLFSSSNNQLSGNNITANSDGIVLDSSSNYNDIFGNNITGNDYDGIVLDGSSDHNTISGNNITTNNRDGIGLYSSSNYISILENNITNNNDFGIYLDSSLHNSIFGNDITANSEGIVLYSSSNNNSIFGNNITNNEIGIELYESLNNRFFHNNFIDNTEQQVEIITPGYANFWNDSYPSGGNYWSDYELKYPDANERDNSGIWDTSYLIDADNQDNYPLMDPYSPPTLTILSSPIGGVTFIVDAISSTTPWSGSYYDGISVDLVMPEIYDVGDARYNWTQWSDGDTSRSRTVVMDADITLTANYTGPYYQLTVTSSPMTGVTFTIDGVPQITPYTDWLLEGSYTLEMPETHDGYNWSHWLEDGNTDTNRIKTVTMDKSITLTGVFADITPPTISIIFPGNKTYTESDVPLFFVVSESTSWMGYSLDSQMNVTINGNTTIDDLPDGIHTLTVYANDTAGNMGSSETVYFTVDTSIPDTFPPTVWILSPQNKTYTTTDIPLTVIVDENVTWMAYSLDDQANKTFSETTTLSGLSNGLHRLIAYANDTAGNMGASEIIYFSIDTQQRPEPFPMWIVAVIVIIAAFGTAVYLLKIRKKS